MQKGTVIWTTVNMEDKNGEYKAELSAPTYVLLTKALKQMEYTMLTVYGPSDMTNKHLPTSPLHCIGQGPLNALPGWSFSVDV
eukprot:3102425-Ditylum_brightwellii.AAC.1